MAVKAPASIVANQCRTGHIATPSALAASRPRDPEGGSEAGATSAWFGDDGLGISAPRRCQSRTLTEAQGCATQLEKKAAGLYSKAPRRSIGVPRAPELVLGVPARHARLDQSPLGTCACPARGLADCWAGTCFPLDWGGEENMGGLDCVPPAPLQVADAQLGCCASGHHGVFGCDV